MTSNTYACHVVARHGYAIERLKRDMAVEPSRNDLARFLAYDAANFVWAFLLASGNNVTVGDKALRNALVDAVLAVLVKHGIDYGSFVVRPEIEANAPLPDPDSW